MNQHEQLPEYTTQEIMTWPNTPGIHRYHSADKYLDLTIDEDLDEPPQGTPINQYPDHVILATVLLDPFLTAEVEEDISNITVVTTTGKLIEKLLEAMDPLCSGTTIGIVVHNTVNLSLNEQITTQATMTEPIPEMDQFTADVTLGRLSRHQDWMGIAPLLPSLRGLNAIVFESPTEPGKTHAVVAMRPEDAPLHPAPSIFPEGEPSVLRDLLTWHGAHPYWFPWAAHADAQASP